VLGEANLLRIGDSSSVGYSRTEATNDWDFSYTLPLNARDGTLSFAYYQSETKALQPPFDDIHGAGNSSDYELAFRSYELTLRQPVRRSVRGESDRLGEQQPTSEQPLTTISLLDVGCGELLASPPVFWGLHHIDSILSRRRRG
jgi:hypothetical protein